IKYNLVFSIAITFTSFMLKEPFSISRRGMVYFFLINSLAIYLMDSIIKKYKQSIYSRFKNRKKLFLITATSRLEKAYERLTSSKYSTRELVGVTIMDDTTFSQAQVAIVAPQDMVDFVTQEVVDEVFINLPSEDYDIGDLVSRFESMGIDVSVNLNAFDFLSLGEKRIQEVAGMSVVTFSTNFYKQTHVIAKRCLDIVGALFGLLVCGLVSIVLVPIIRKDGGPAFFVQKRVGKNGRFFKFYKFRSMRVDAEEIKKELMEHNTMTGGMFKMDNDPRVTPIGRFIRKTSLDELPQFYNVLIGDMSLVGTRPPTVDEYRNYTPEQKRRLSFKPGITGLWQVSGRSAITDFDEVVKLDLAYMDGWTIWRDIKILLKTIKVVFRKEGAK
ncbi:sugar transferase, partial [Streptococcus gordonii]